MVKKVPLLTSYKQKFVEAGNDFMTVCTFLQYSGNRLSFKVARSS